MRSGTYSTLGTWTRTTVYTNGSPPVTTQGVRTSSSVTVGHDVIRKGDHKKPNAWSFHVIDSSSLSGTLRTVSSSRTVTEHGVLATGSGITQGNSVISIAQTRADRLALEDFYSKLSGDSDFGSNAAEGGSLKSSSQQVIQAADNVRNQAGTYGLKTIGKAWLAAQYVWKPACNDIYNAVSAITGQATRNGFKVVGKGSCTETFDPETISIGGFGFNAPVQGNVKARCRIVGKFRCNPAFDVVAQLTSFDPLVLAWNALPYSFVVDWFYNVGGYLQALEAAARYQSAFAGGGYKSSSYKCDSFISHHGASFSAPGVSTSCSSRYYKIGNNRTLLSSIPTPRPPRLNADLGSGTLLNAAALLASKLRF